MATERDAWIVYTNWKGETERRHIEPGYLFHGVSPWHADPQWLLDAWDLDRGALRTFALSGIRAWAATVEALSEDAPASPAPPVDRPPADGYNPL